MRAWIIATALAVATVTAATVTLSGKQIKQTVQGLAGVVDGDTVIVNGVHVRLKGVDAPEPSQSGGPQSTLAMRAIVGNWLKCELTGEKTYKRDVGYCFNAAGEDIAPAIISRGLALSCPYFDIDRRYFKFEQSETQRRQPRASYCLGPPVAFLSPGPPISATPPTPPGDDCLIKGNINSKRERIYHMPGQRYYDATVIDPSNGERWFCTEDEATGAGWRKSKV